MDLKRNNVSEARRPLRRRALLCGSIIVLCGLIGIICFLAADNPGSVQTRADTLPAVADACQPDLRGPNDVIGATTPAEPHSNQPEQVPDDLVEMVSNEVIERAEDILPAEIRPHRAELLRTLSKETTLDSIENLPNFDDTRVSVAITDALPTDSFAYLTQF
ncbi:MAG: hypothetical protein ACYTBJ_18820, partial [Planctomycetota bacterium]